MFEENLQNSVFSQNSEKTYIDKILARSDVDLARNIIKKKELTREDIIELLNQLSSNETKLLNYSEWDRYIMAKYFVWIREFVSITESLFDYKDDLTKKQNTCRYCNEMIGKECKCDKPVPILKLTPRTKQLFKNNMRYMEHNLKFLVDLYFNLCRTTLSLGATGFMELLKNKYEIHYPSMANVQTPTQQSAPLIVNPKK